MTSYLKKLTSSSIWFSLVLNIYGCNKIKENQIYNFKEQEQYQANMQRALNKYTTAQEIIGSIELNLGSLSKTATDLKPLINKQFNNIIKQQVGSLKIKSLKLSNYHKALAQDNDFTGNIKYEHQEMWKPEFFHPEMLFVFYSDINLQSTIFPNLTFKRQPSGINSICQIITTHYSCDYTWYFHIKYQ